MSPSLRVLLCSDLDRTLLPNGAQPESPDARPRLRRLAARPELTLAYVSGRHKALVQEAIAHYGIPEPRFAVCDVGTTIYTVQNGLWRPWEAWAEEIAPDWRGKTHSELVALFQDLDELKLQEPAKQNTYKISYYAPAALDHRALIRHMQQRLEPAGVAASLIWSVDETTDTGLLDILPRGATKLHAVRFVMEREGFEPRYTVFAGDSGNDLPVLTSGMQAVLVANASDAVRRQALAELAHGPGRDALYLAHGGFMGMNGNYSAGVLEGLAHFVPQAHEWMGD